MEVFASASGIGDARNSGGSAPGNAAWGTRRASAARASRQPGRRQLHMMSAKGEPGFREGVKPDKRSLHRYFNLSCGDTPMKGYQTSLMETEVSRTTNFQGKESVGKGEFNFGSRAEKPFILSVDGVRQNGVSKVPGNAGSQEEHIHKAKVPAMGNIFSFDIKFLANEAVTGKGGSRWRSNESSEDEDEKRTYMESGASRGTRRRPRLCRRC